jgi:hypothetical protein
VAALLLVGAMCGCVLGARTGSVRVQLGVDGTGKTLYPSELPVVSYLLSFSGPGAVSPVSTSSSSVTVDLAVGSWDITVEGLDAGGVTVARGSVSGVVVEEGNTAAATVQLGALGTGTGGIDVTVSWPAEATVVGQEVRLDGVVESYTQPTATSVRYTASKAAGEYELEVSLDTGEASPTVVTDLVRVYGNVTTAATIELGAGDFTAPPAAPSGLAATGVGAAIDLAWTDNSHVETGYVVERREASGSYSGLAYATLGADAESYSDTGAALGVTYYYRVKAVNSFGDSSYSNEASASLPLPPAQIIADHTVVDEYSTIPKVWIDEVKKMWLDVPGESHSEAYRTGLVLLEAIDAKFAVSVVDAGDPEPYTTANLRTSRATWGDVENTGGWRYYYGEEDWFTSATAVARTKAHLDYAHSNSLPIAAMGFGWCWDMTWWNPPSGTADPVYGVRWAGASNGGPEGNLRWGLDAADASLTGNSVCLDTYLAATQQYIDYCASKGYSTAVFFTTGPVDDGPDFTAESGYQRELKNTRIRDYVAADASRNLFDYADILAWSNAGVENRQQWSAGKEYQVIHPDNLGDGSIGHIGSAGALRLGKALWWMLARIAGWDGTPG